MANVYLKPVKKSLKKMIFQHKKFQTNIPKIFKMIKKVFNVTILRKAVILPKQKRNSTKLNLKIFKSLIISLKGKMTPLTINNLAKSHPSKFYLLVRYHPYASIKIYQMSKVWPLK